MQTHPQRLPADGPVKAYPVRSRPHGTAVRASLLGLIYLPFAVLSALDGSVGGALGFAAVALVHQLFLIAEWLRIRRQRGGDPVHGLLLYRDRLEWRGAHIHWRMPSHRIPYREIGGVALNAVRSRAGTRWFLQVRIMPPGATRTEREISLPIDWIEADRASLVPEVEALLHPASTARAQAFGLRARRR